jgi:hypothetical protein
MLVITITARHSRRYNICENVFTQARHPEQAEGPPHVIEDLRDPSLSLRMTTNGF